MTGAPQVELLLHARLTAKEEMANMESYLAENLTGGWVGGRGGGEVDCTFSNRAQIISYCSIGPDKIVHWQFWQITCLLFEEKYIWGLINTNGSGPSTVFDYRLFSKLHRYCLGSTDYLYVKAHQEKVSTVQFAVPTETNMHGKGTERQVKSRKGQNQFLGNGALSHRVWRFLCNAHQQVWGKKPNMFSV